MPEGGPYRDVSAPIASRADLDWSRMGGSWTIVQGAAFGPLGQPGAALSLEIGEAGGEIRIASPTRTTQIPVEIAGPGRLRALDRPRELWVLWGDADYRTVAIGTPDGAFGWIMDRNGASSRDRLEAARTIMDWYGYDLDALKENGR
ncbi:lipocalin family protein [Aestuariibius insulae]|uniref:lipocalin family protein n=1 Tax=Aestuariibius insulae TaxID=2058287 RepID=UPI00345F0B09